jgi:hypothetical protein
MLNSTAAVRIQRPHYTQVIGFYKGFVFSFDFGKAHPPFDPLTKLKINTRSVYNARAGFNHVSFFLFPGLVTKSVRDQCLLFGLRYCFWVQPVKHILKNNDFEKGSVMKLQKPECKNKALPYSALLCIRVLTWNYEFGIRFLIRS